MKHILIILLYSFSLFSYAITDTTDYVSNFLSEEECRRIDSLFAKSSHFISTNDDTIKNSRIEQRTSATIEYSYVTKYYIAQDPLLVDRIGRILVICDNITYDSLATQVVRYAKDIHNAYGCAVHVYSLHGGCASDIRQLIKSNYDENPSFLSGVVLIGDIDYAEFHTPVYQDIRPNDTIDWYAEDFPCDYYYMDLDGIWVDTDGNGIFDQHTGNIAPEIFVGRICAMHIQNSHLALSQYFDKNHSYWIGHKKINRKRGLSFTYHEWSTYQFRVGIQQLYGSENTDNIQDSQFIKSTYTDVITDETYEFIQLACHSSYEKHFFSNANNAPTLTIFELDSLNLKTLGYNLYCCQACRWVEPNSCLGEHYIYSTNSETLSLVGSTKIGGMAEGMKTFYKYLGEGDCMGTAYRIWWKDVASKINDAARRYRWYYGMCILGDPMINFLYDNQCNEEVNISSWNQNNTSDKHIYYAQEEIAASCTIPHNKTLELHANNVRLTDGFCAPAGSNLHISIESCFNNSVSPQRINKRDGTTTTETGVKNISASAEIQVYPNPCSNTISINGVTENKIRYMIYDMNGVLVNSGFNDGKNIDVSMLPTGLYNLVVENRDGSIKANGLKIIKQ